MEDSHGREALREWLRWYLFAFADREWTVHEVISEGDDSIDKAEERLYGVLRHLITPTYEYGHVHWFVKAEGSPDGFTYKMFDREAEWIKEASEHE